MDDDHLDDIFRSPTCVHPLLLFIFPFFFKKRKAIDGHRSGDQPMIEQDLVQRPMANWPGDLDFTIGALLLPLWGADRPKRVTRF